MISHLKRRFGIFTTLAVLTSVCAAVSIATVSPVSAAPATTAITALTIDDAADYSACPASASIPSAGFTDTTDTAVDCLAYYGITLGTTATTYEPTASVSRWQMALYITRAHTEAGGTLGTGADQDFTDISGKSSEIQTAINQIKQLGVTVGKTATTFAPDDNVTREEMAMFIERWLETVAAGPGGTSEDDAAVALVAASVTYVNNDCGSAQVAMTCTGLYNYTDIDSGSVTVEGSLAIKELFTMGIHDGVSATTYNPGSDMTRAAMATFMTAALAHTNLRPEGLHIQAVASSAVGNNSSALHVSYRDASFDPIVAAPIDMFYWTDTLGAEGQGSWTSTGLCNASYITTEASSLTECYIDTGDPKTNDSGNIAPASASAVAVSTLYAGAQTHYAWTDAVATTFDNDTKGSGNKFASAVISSSPAADELTCSVDVDAQALTATAVHTVHFAAVTTVTCQFMSGPTQGAAIGIAVPLAGSYATLTNTRTFTQDSTLLQQTDVTASYSTIAVSSASGAFSWTITGPTDTTGDDSYTDVINITRSTGGAGIGNATTASYSGHMAEGACGSAGASDTDICFGLIYDDNAAAGNSVGMTQATSSAAAATTGVSRSNTATVYDQYGDTMAGIVVTFTSASELPGGLHCTAIAVSVCTTILAHGLTAGDLLDYKDDGSFTCAVSCGAVGVQAPVAGVAFCVGTVLTTTTFNLQDDDCSTAVNASAGAASVAATPLQLTRRSFAHSANTRTTGSAGTATFSWVDTEGTSGEDTVTATSSASDTATAEFWRLTTSADFISTTTTDATLADGLTCAYLVEFDAVGQDYILKIASGTDISGTITYVYKQYTYDSNDNFADGGDIAANAPGKYGDPATMAAWVTDMATLMATSLAAGVDGVCDDVTYVDVTATPVASVQRHVNSN